MAVFNTRFYREENDSLYSDGEIENELMKRVCQKDETLETDSDWTVFYHFSRLRQNILNWYPFPEGCTILEIGGGCGALTGMLCQKASHVTTCELTMRRAKIIYERHKSVNNLELVVGNFLEASFDRKFDYVVINGVLEYAKGIMGGKTHDPYTDFLEQAKNYLKPGGMILLSIENRVGLKYFAGAAEDHVGKFYAGINGYCQGEHVRTFTRSELIELCHNAGLQVYNWFYPYPDYKFPTEIFTDDSVNVIVPTDSDAAYDMARAKLFDKQEVYHALMRDGIAGYFSNSFLLELGATEVEQDRPMPTYVKISNNRKRECSICTLVYGKNGYVEKKALDPQGYAHLRKMEDIGEPMGILHTLRGEFLEGVFTCRIVPKESLHSVLRVLTQSGDRDGFWEKIAVLRGSVYGDVEPGHCKRSAEFENVFGPQSVCKPLHWRSGLNIDLNADNIFFGDTHWTVIDNEWVFPFKIPGEFVIWRMLVQLRAEAPFNSVISEDDVNHFLEIDSDVVRAFHQWELHFAQHYVGIQDLSIHCLPEYPVDLAAEIERQKHSQTLVSHLFLFGKQGEVELLECYGKNKDGYWSVCFESDHISAAEAIRWDPLEGNACHISEVQLEKLTAIPVNADAQEPDYTFATFDPQFSIEGDWSSQSRIEIRFKCELLDWTEGFFRLEADRNREHELHLHEKVMRERLMEDLNGEIQNLKSLLTAEKKKAQQLDKQLIQQRDTSAALTLELQNTQGALEAEHTAMLLWKERYGKLHERLKEHKWEMIWKIMKGVDV